MVLQDGRHALRGAPAADAVVARAEGTGAAGRGGFPEEGRAAALGGAEGEEDAGGCPVAIGGGVLVRGGEREEGAGCEVRQRT